MGKTRKRYRAVFIDRDGTIIRERNYLRRIKDVKLLTGAVEALRLLRDAGYRLFLITNQSGIGRGYLTERKLGQIHGHLEKTLEKKGAHFDGIYYCPHHPDDDCSCRKPKLGLIRRAQRRYNIDLKNSFAVGDHVNDFRLGQNMGGKGIFVLTGHGRQEYKKIQASRGALKPDRVTGSVLNAARWILQQDKKAARS